jgi:hypothetical protein
MLQPRPSTPVMVPTTPRMKLVTSMDRKFASSEASRLEFVPESPQFLLLVSPLNVRGRSHPRLQIEVS